MKAAVVVEPGVIDIQTVQIPHPSAEQVRIKLEGCGVCHSNLPPWEGRPWFNYPMEPGALGHEAWGQIDTIGSKVTGFTVGQRVAFLSSHAYAEYDVADANAVAALPTSLDGVPFPGEPLGCAMNIFRRSGIRSGQTVAVVGIGFLGALQTRLATAAGAHVIAVSRREYSLKLARSMGAAETIRMEDHWKIVEQVKAITGGKFCDVTIEAVGQQWPLDLAAELTKERGRLIVAGYHQDGPRQVNMQLWNWRGLDVINAHERDQQVYLEGMSQAIDAVSCKDIDPSGLYTHTFPLEGLAEALNMTRDRPDGFVKALVMF
jgi:threonine dehydrogenase-like Zn-dependent dehydrogenase